MAVEQKNFGLFTYTDNGGQSWNKRGEIDAVRNAVDGSTAAGAHPSWGRSTRRHRVRTAVYQDPTTFRTKTVTLYTQAASDALTVNTSTLTFKIEGSAADVIYTLRKLSGEAPISSLAGSHLIEHA